MSCLKELEVDARILLDPLLENSQANDKNILVFSTSIVDLLPPSMSRYSSFYNKLVTRSLKASSSLRQGPVPQAPDDPNESFSSKVSHVAPEGLLFDQRPTEGQATR